MNISYCYDTVAQCRYCPLRAQPITIYFWAFKPKMHLDFKEIIKLAISSDLGCHHKQK